MLSWGEYLAYGVKDPEFRDEDVEQEKRFDPRMYPAGINADFDNYKGAPKEAFIADFTSRFEIPENRDIALCADELMDLFRNYSNFQSGCKVVDFGSGTGLFLKRFSDAVGQTGAVVATDVSDIFVERLSTMISDSNITNAVVVKSTSKALNIDSYDGSIDTVVICDVYHHLEFPKTLMRQVRRALKPETGRLIVVDFIRDNAVHKSHAKDWILQHVRASQSTFRREILSCGYSLVAEPCLKRLSENYIMVFKPVELSAVGAGWAQSSSIARVVKQSLPSGFVFLDDICKSIQISPRYFGNENFLGCRVDGYEVPRVVLSRAAAEALAHVQSVVQRDGFSLVVYDGYRPQRAVNHFMRWSEDHTDQLRKEQYYPDIDKRDVFKLGYIADKSGHSRGSTVDLTIIKQDQSCLLVPTVSVREFTLPGGGSISLPFLDDKTVDMGTSFDLLGEASHENCPFIPEACLSSRQYLKRVMNEAGFDGYDQEWWHFTLLEEPYPTSYFDFPIA